MKENRWFVFGMVFMVVSLLVPIAEGKKRRGGSSPLKILNVTKSLSRFEAGNGELTFSMMVTVPKKLKGANVLEVSALITSPTRRSMRFLTQRIPLGSTPPAHKGPQVPATLSWDGKDQNQKVVESGTYRYEIRAKLMADTGNGARTRIVSRKSRGTVEVKKFRGPIETTKRDSPKIKAPQVDPPSEKSALESDEAQIEDQEGIGQVAGQSTPDEIEMLPDESTGHPIPEPGEEDSATSEEEVPVQQNPQEG